MHGLAHRQRLSRIAYTYVNDMPREATARDVGNNYRGNQAKLVALKTKYDPTNLFRLNANIQPARASAA